MSSCNYSWMGVPPACVLLLLLLVGSVPHLDAFHASANRLHVGRTPSISHGSAARFPATTSRIPINTSTSTKNQQKQRMICRQSSTSRVDVGEKADNNDNDNKKTADIQDDDLMTKQDLTIRIFEARDYYRQRPDEGMTQAAICTALLSTRLPNLPLNRCFTAESTVGGGEGAAAGGGGTGVFASRTILEGELVTLYPGDAVLLQDSTADDSAAAPVGVLFGTRRSPDGVDRDITRVTSHAARSYELEVNRYTSIVGDPSIGTDDPAYLGHFINDGATLTEFDDASRDIYTKATTARCNVNTFVVEGGHMAIVATNDIAKGAELFLSYGTGYWLSRSRAESSTTKNTGGVVQMETAVPKGRGAGVILGNYIPRVGIPGGGTAAAAAAAAAAPSGKQNREARRSSKNKKKGPKGNWKGFN